MRRRALLVVTLLIGSAWAEGLVLRTASQVGLPHKYNRGKAGHQGFCIDYLQGLQQVDPGLSFTGLEQNLPTPRIEAELAASRLDVFVGLLKTPERAKVMRFIDSPGLYGVQHQVAIRADDDLLVNNFDDIRALGREGVILATRSTGYYSFLSAQRGLVIDVGTSDLTQSLHKLLKGRGRMVYEAGANLRRVIEANGLAEQVRILPAVFHREQQAVACSPSLPEASVARLSAAMNVLEASGEAQRLRLAYGLA